MKDQFGRAMADYQNDDFTWHATGGVGTLDESVYGKFNAIGSGAGHGQGIRG